MQGLDVPAVARLLGELGYPTTEAETRRRYDLIRDSRDARLLVAEDTAGVVVGWIHVQATYLLECDPRAEIWGLVVSEVARGSGVGRRLVEAAEQWAARRGLQVMSLRSNALRTQARGFYEHLGYAVTKTQYAFRKKLS